MLVDIDSNEPLISLQKQQEQIVQHDITKLQADINQHSTVTRFKSSGDHDSDTGTDLLDIEDNNRYHKAIKTIPVYNRDDGKFGLNVKSNTIGGFPYTVTGNRLSVDVGAETNKIFDIEDVDVWKWLIIRNPIGTLDTFKEANEPAPAFREYIRIVKSLRLLDRAQHAAAANGKNSLEGDTKI